MRFPYVVLLSACALMLALPLVAQTTNGVINGLVVDPSTHVIVGADVVVVNDVTSLKYTTKTNEDGIYVLPNLPPGPYRLQVSKVGFKTLIKPDIVLNIQDALSINFTLPVGAAFETVTVEGGASMINTTDASVSTVIDHSYVENMPLNGRSFQDLILLTPGIVTQSPQNNGNSFLGQTGEFSVNGQRQESNNYTVDGVSSNVGASAGLSMVTGAGASGSVPAATALGTTQALVSVDDLQEFRVQSSTYSAEYGRSPGGQFAFETKSGTNQWHGTAYDYLRNGFFDAQDWFNDYFVNPEPAVRQNDFGATIGGPLRTPGLHQGKDKTFFFVSYEGLRLAQPQASRVSFVPDNALRASAPYPLNQVLNAFPVPNGFDDTVNGIAQFIGTWSNPSSIDSSSVRFDRAVNDKLRLFFRFSDTLSSSTSRNSVGVVLGNPAVSQTTATSTRTYTAGTSSVFTNRLSNEFRINYTSNEVTGHAEINSFGGSTPTDLFQLTGLGPRAQPGLFLVYGGYTVAIAPTSASAVQRQWNVVDTVNYSWGRHHLRWGIDFRRLTPIATPPSLIQSYLYFSPNAVRTNDALAETIAVAPAYPSYTNSSVFAQDEWRVSERVTLSMGLRWEVNPAPGVTQGLKPYTVEGAGPGTWMLAPEGTPLWRTTWFNFAPRLGVAYVLRNSVGHETVLRGGGGVFFDTGQQVGSFGFDGLGFQAFASQTAPFPSSIATPVIKNPPQTPYDTTAVPIVFPTHLQLPYTLQWNASVGQALGKSQLVTLSYVGSHASRLLTEAEVSTLNNPNSGSFLFIESGLTSDYESLQAQFQRRLTAGLTTLASYTVSHCIDYGSQNYALAAQRGNCDFDVRHNLSAALSYDLPNPGQNEFAKAILQRWGIDDRLIARTAFPVTLNGNQYFDPLTGQLLNSGLDLVSGSPIYLYGANCASILQGLQELQPGQRCPGGRAVNPSAFAAPLADPYTGSSLRQGTAPRNFVRGFGAWQMNVATRRDFSIHEGLKLQFRAEAFNVFNHPNFGTINPTYCSGAGCTFGQATGTLATSLGGILSPLYQMGGPRSMQFALKLMF
jgi:hypothetical protein